MEVVLRLDRKLYIIVNFCLLMGNLSKRNKKVAISRWKKEHERQKSLVDNSSQGLLKKVILCGFIAGDGNIHIREDVSNYEMRFFPDDEEMLDTYIETIQSVYGSIPSVFPKKNYYSVRPYYSVFGICEDSLFCPIFK